MEEKKEESSHHRYNLRKRRSRPSETNGRRNNNFNQEDQRNREPAGILSWENLNEGPLHEILRRLNMVDYFIAGSICKRWNLLSSVARQSYFKSKPPLVVLAPESARKICSLFDISSGVKCATTLPCFGRRELIGVSCGYLILRHVSGDILLVNPLTKKEHHLAGIPQSKVYFPKERSIIAFSKPHQDIFLVVPSIMESRLQLHRLKNDSYDVLSFTQKRWIIIDMIFFKEKLLVLTMDACICTIDLEFLDNGTFLKLNGKPEISLSGRFAAFGEELFVIYFDPENRLDVYKIDFVTQHWVKVDSLGDRVIFLCNLSCSMLDNPRKWGGRPNSLYHLSSSTVCDVYSLNGQVLNNFYLLEHVPDFFRISCWYAQHESLEIDDVKEN